MKSKLDEIHAYANHDSVPSLALVRMAKLGVVISDWMQANDLQATALQCWTSIHKNYGINACTLMSMMSDQFMPSACETDITGTVSMDALQLASNSPGTLVDWNNNYADDPDRCVLFHCGNWVKSFIPDIEIKTAPILGTTLGEENTYGAMAADVVSSLDNKILQAKPALCNQSSFPFCLISAHCISQRRIADNHKMGQGANYYLFMFSRWCDITDNPHFITAI